MLSKLLKNLWQFRREGLALTAIVLLDRAGWLPSLTNLGQSAASGNARLGVLLLIAATLLVALIKILGDLNQEAPRNRNLAFDEAGD